MHPDGSGEPGAERERGRALLLTCAEHAGGGGPLGHLDVSSTQSIPHLHTGSCAKPQGDLQPRGVKTVGGETMSIRLLVIYSIGRGGRSKEGLEHGEGRCREWS